MKKEIERLKKEKNINNESKNKFKLRFIYKNKE